MHTTRNRWARLCRAVILRIRGCRGAFRTFRDLDRSGMNINREGRE